MNDNELRNEFQDIVTRLNHGVLDCFDHWDYAGAQDILMQTCKKLFDFNRKVSRFEMMTNKDCTK